MGASNARRDIINQVRELLQDLTDEELSTLADLASFELMDREAVVQANSLDTDEETKDALDIDHIGDDYGSDA